MMKIKGFFNSILGSLKSTPAEAKPEAKPKRKKRYISEKNKRILEVIGPQDRYKSPWARFRHRINKIIAWETAKAKSEDRSRSWER